MAARRRLVVASLALVVSGLAMAGATVSHACAPAPPADRVVRIIDESAIITWDEASSTETFVRRAAFTGDTSSFGFLVPTPSKPELGEMGDEIFDRLDQATRPEIVYEPQTKLVPTFLCALHLPTKGEAAAPASVRVIDAKVVAGLDAVVLEADSASALADWLKAHDYAFGPQLRAWVTPYVEHRWKLTAFKIASDAGASVQTKAVKMRFATTKPFFPYREPSEPAGDKATPRSRSLRVYYFGPGRADGAIANGAPWPGKVMWASAATAIGSNSQSIAASAAGLELPPNAWLTSFVDDASPRPGVDDLFFARAALQEDIRPPKVRIPDLREVPIPLDLLLLTAGVIALIARKLTKRSEPTQDEPPL
jgi:hypothetical protein